MRRLGLLALLLLPALAAAQPVYRLDGTDPALPQADLEPLKKILGKAPVVALGESIHTSGGFYEMKHRVFRFLVEKMGFRVLAIESAWIDAERASQYVRTCEGTPEDAIRGLYTVWQSAEIRDLLQWMCDWNRGHRRRQDKLHFFGFDIQQPEDDRPALLAFLDRIGIGADDPLAAGVAACEGVSKLYPDPIPEERYQRCLAGLDEVERLFRKEEPSLVRRTSRSDLARARMSLVGLRAWQGYAYYAGLGDMAASHESRDSGMAWVFQSIRKLRHPKSRTVVWAHNFHIARRLEEASFHTRTMGSFLREAFGPSYATIALTAHETGIDWQEVGCGTIRAPGGSVEAKLHDLGHEHLLLDLRGDPPFLTPGEVLLLGEYDMVPADQFDGILYLDVSRKMSPLAWPPCR
ncbi:MAG TPA: erythromycin esterase family protein [Thermoanaerobaculia bacterium]|nr:erythromycin esterase family protein [Thermoanaerobaculia bacterium]